MILVLIACFIPHGFGVENTCTAAVDLENKYQDAQTCEMRAEDILEPIFHPEEDKIKYNWACVSDKEANNLLSLERKAKMLAGYHDKIDINWRMR